MVFDFVINYNWHETSLIPGLCGGNPAAGGCHLTVENIALTTSSCETNLGYLSQNVFENMQLPEQIRNKWLAMQRLLPVDLISYYLYQMPVKLLALNFEISVL